MNTVPLMPDCSYIQLLWEKGGFVYCLHIWQDGNRIDKCRFEVSLCEEPIFAELMTGFHLLYCRHSTVKLEANDDSPHTNNIKTLESGKRW